MTDRTNESLCFIAAIVTFSSALSSLIVFGFEYALYNAPVTIIGLIGIIYYLTKGTKRKKAIATCQRCMWTGRLSTFTSKHDLKGWRCPACTSGSISIKCLYL